MQGDFIEKEDVRPISGYGSALLVDENGDGYYSLVIPLETVSTVAGDYESFEYNILISRTKGKVKGKLELDDASIDFLWTRENIYRLKQLENRTLSYATFDENNVFIPFTAQLSYRRNDAEADVMRGTLTLTPMSLGEVILDGRDFVRQTLDFTGTLPDSIALNSTTKTQTINLAVAQAAQNVTFTPKVEGSTDITATVTGGKLTIKVDDTNPPTTTTYATVYITATSTDKIGDGDALKYAPWTMTIAVTFNPPTSAE